MTLGFCNLDEAFNTTAKLNKKKKRFSRKHLNDETMDKILGRGEEIDTGILPGEPRPGGPRPNGHMDKLSTDSDYVNSLAETYDQNSLFVQKKQEELLSKEGNKDAEPNDIQREKNEESKQEINELKMQILDLSKVVGDLAKTIQAPKEVETPKRDIKEGYTNYNIDPNIVQNFKSKITFDNDQFNELLLYVFTGIFLLILIDYIYNLGKKAF